MSEKHNPDKEISASRKAMYYGGLALMVVGFLLFFSVFVSGFTRMNAPSFDYGNSYMGRGLVGFLLVLAGAILRGIGARGLAGSGLLLNPKKAREDLAPYTDALGGMAKDAVEGFQKAGGAAGREVIKVRCAACRALNEEQDKFCSQCGKPL